MARMKWDDEDIDWRGLDSAEYNDDGDFSDYSGEIPPANTLLDGDVKKVWIVKSQAGNTMLKVLFEAAGNEGDLKEYDGLPLWENVVFTSEAAKFRWQPFLDAVGITLRDIKAKTIIGEEDNVGVVVEKIGKVDFTEPVPIRVRTAIEKKGEYKGEAKVGRWLPADDESDDDLDDEEEPF